MPKKNWPVFPYPNADYDYPGGALHEHWERLHLGDCEPFPDAEYIAGLCQAHPGLEDELDGDYTAVAARLQDAWRAFHRGEFQEAHEQGLELGVLGATVANKSAGIHAHYLEDDERRALAFFEEAVARAEAAMKALPEACNAYYQRAYNLGRYSQGISIAKALTQGLGGKVKRSLEHTLRLAPDHAEAHTALGMFHAEVIGQVGAMVAKVTYGANRDEAIRHFENALRLHPESAVAKMEYGNGLLLLFGDKRVGDATRLYEEAADAVPVDAMERLDVEQAKAELE